MDADGDGLIEIYDLTMLHNMRYNLAGTSYKESAGDTGDTSGCPDATPADGSADEDCTGYELVRDLDFDRDGDGRTWDSETLTLDAGDSQAPYFVTARGGWEPIGDCGADGQCGGGGAGDDNFFTATLEGNGFVIRNLAVRRNQSQIGLLGYARNATLRNLGLEDALADYSGDQW